MHERTFFFVTGPASDGSSSVLLSRLRQQICALPEIWFAAHRGTLHEMIDDAPEPRTLRASRLQSLHPRVPRAWKMNVISILRLFEPFPQFFVVAKLVREKSWPSTES